jgi:hypothetical protein
MTYRISGFHAETARRMPFMIGESCEVSMKIRKVVLMASAATLLAFALLVVARAQDAPPQEIPPQQEGYPQQTPPLPQQGPQQPQNDPNQPGVARLSFIRGDVSVQRGDSGETSTATLNTPLEAGDKILTGASSRTELQLDSADILRLDQNSQANIATLANNRIQIQVGQGLASYSVMKGGSADVEIDTPNVSVHPTKEGRYRLEVNADGDTEIIVRDGEADISTSQGTTKVHRGDLITIHGTGDDAQYKVTGAPSVDDFDTWNQSRDGIIYNANAWQHTNRNYTGANDLDSYGVWNEVPDYGPVWLPSVDPGWAPYRAGRWVYEPYWGWTWTSYEPWGWAPYHYGRWFMYGSRWAWWPGPVYGGYRPIWAPAYVSFFGYGPGIGVSFGFGFGFGSIGWLPIGPGDYFHPWYGGFRDRFAVADFNHFGELHEGFAPLHGGGGFSNVRGVMTDDRLRAGMSGVAAGSFGHGAIIARSVSAEDFRGARAMTGNVPVVPGRDSLRTSDRMVNPSLAARGNQQQHFYSRTSPANRPESFSQASSRVQSGLQRNNIQYHGGAEANPGAANAGRSFNSGNAGPAYRPQASGGAERGAQGQGGSEIHAGNAPRTYYGQGQSEGGTARGYEGQGQAQGGWQRFSGPTGAESASRSGQGSAQGGSPAYRPSLNMSKPIVTERSQGGNSGYAGSNQRGYSAPTERGYSSAPAYRPSAPSAPSPSYRSAPSPSYRGGGSAGGGSRSGGGSRGGGHSGGGHR